MSGNYKRDNIGLLGIIPELVQGVPNWDFNQKAGGGGANTFTVNVTAGSGAHDLNIAGANANYFQGMKLRFRNDTTTTALQGKEYTILSFLVAGGVATFTTTANMAATPAATDRAVVWCPLPASSVKPDVTAVEDLKRDEFERVTYDPPSSIPGLPSCKVSFDCEIPGLETPSGNGSAAATDRFSHLLKAIGTRTASNGLTLGADVHTVNVIKMADTTGRNVGDHVLINNQVRKIKTVTTNTSIEIEPDLSAAPNNAGGDVLYAAEEWVPVDESHQSLTVLYLKDDQLFELLGCVGTFKGTMTWGKLQKYSFEFQGEDYTITDSYALTGSQSTKKAIAMTAGAVYFGTTAIGVNECGFDQGGGMEEIRDTVENHSMRVSSRKSTASVKFRNTVKTPKTTWETAKTQAHLLAYGGNAAGACVGIGGNGQFDSVGLGEHAKLSYWDGKISFVDDQTDVTTAHKLHFFRF